MKNGKKQKQHSEFVLQRALMEVAHTPSSESGTPGVTLSILASSHHSFVLCL